MKTFLYFSQNRIRKDEVPGVVKSAIQIVFKHNPVVLGVDPFYQLLLEKQSQLEQFSDTRTAHPLTEVIKNDRIRMVELTKSIEMQSRAVKKGKLDTMSDAAFVVIPVIKKYLMNLERKNSKAVDKQVESFLAVLAHNEELRLAIASIKINEYVEELKVIQDRLKVNVDKRREDESKRRIIDPKQLKSEIMNALTNLLKAIELATVQHKDVDYMPLIAELNQLFIPYRALGRSRSTRSKNEAIKNETVAMSATTSATAN